MSTNTKLSGEERARWSAWFKDLEEKANDTAGVASRRTHQLVIGYLGHDKPTPRVAARVSQQLSRIRSGDEAGLRLLVSADHAAIQDALGDALQVPPSAFESKLQNLQTRDVSEIPELGDPPVLVPPTLAAPSGATDGRPTHIVRPLRAWLADSAKELAGAGVGEVVLEVCGTPGSGRTTVTKLCQGALGGVVAVREGGTTLPLPPDPTLFPQPVVQPAPRLVSISTVAWQPEDLERNLKELDEESATKIASRLIEPWRRAPHALRSRQRRADRLVALMRHVLGDEADFEPARLRSAELRELMRRISMRVDASDIRDLDSYLLALSRAWLETSCSWDAAWSSAQLHDFGKGHVKKALPPGEVDSREVFRALAGDLEARAKLESSLGGVTSPTAQREALVQGRVIEGDKTRGWRLTPESKELFALLLSRADETLDHAPVLALHAEGVELLADWALMRPNGPAPDLLVIAAREATGLVRVGLYAAALETWLALEEHTGRAQRELLVESWAALLWATLHGLLTEDWPHFLHWEAWRQNLLLTVSKRFRHELPILGPDPHEALRDLVPMGVQEEVSAWRTVPVYGDPPIVRRVGESTDTTSESEQGWATTGVAGAGLSRLAPFQVGFGWLVERRWLSGDSETGAPEMMLPWSMMVEPQVVQHFASLGDTAALRFMAAPERDRGLNLCRGLKASPLDRLRALAQLPPAEELGERVVEALSLSLAVTGMAEHKEWRDAVRATLALYPTLAREILTMLAVRRRCSEAELPSYNARLLTGEHWNLSYRLQLPGEREPAWELDMLVQLGHRDVLEAIVRALDTRTGPTEITRELRGSRDPLKPESPLTPLARLQPFFLLRQDALLAVSRAGDLALLRAFVVDGPVAIQADAVLLDAAWDRAWSEPRLSETFSNTAAWRALREHIVSMPFRDSPYPGWTTAIPGPEASLDKRMTFLFPRRLWLRDRLRHEAANVFARVTRPERLEPVAEPRELWAERAKVLLAARDAETLERWLHAYLHRTPSPLLDSPMDARSLVADPALREHLWAAASNNQSREAIVDLVTASGANRKLEPHWYPRIRAHRPNAARSWAHLAPEAERRVLWRDELADTSQEPWQRLWRRTEFPWDEAAAADVDLAIDQLREDEQALESSSCAWAIRDPGPFERWVGLPSEQLIRILSALYAAAVRLPMSPGNHEAVHLATALLERGADVTIDTELGRSDLRLERLCTKVELQRVVDPTAIWERLESDAPYPFLSLEDVRERLDTLHREGGDGDCYQVVGSRYADRWNERLGPLMISILVRQAFQSNPEPWMKHVSEDRIATLDPDDLRAVESLMELLPSDHPRRARVLHAVFCRRAALLAHRLTEGRP